MSIPSLRMPCNYGSKAYSATAGNPIRKHYQNITSPQEKAAGKVFLINKCIAMCGK